MQIKYKAYIKKAGILLFLVWFLTFLFGHTYGVQASTVQQEAQQKLRAFQNEATQWGNAHMYHDSYDGKNYYLDNGYINFRSAQNGFFGTLSTTLQTELEQSQTTNDYLQTISDTTDAIAELHAFEADAADTTPYNAVHQSDLTIERYYQQNYYPQMQDQQIVLVSLAQQAMRVYTPGMQHLQNAFHITSGADDLTTDIGIFNVQYRVSPTTFQSGYGRGDPRWYPATPINYAIMFNTDGSYIHSTWWRNSQSGFGPGTQFPHNDQTSPPYSTVGSHGCINIYDSYEYPNRNDRSPAAWMYHNTTYDTVIIIY